MMYVCYGMKKSGSTYVHNLTQGLLEAAGHPHFLIPAEIRRDPKPPKHEWANIIRKPDDETMNAIKLAVPTGRIVTLRTHSAVTPAIERLLRSGDGKLQMIVRDLRDVALSYFDTFERKSAQAAIKGKWYGTDRFKGEDFRETFQLLDVNVKNAIAWADCEADTLILDYETAAFQPTLAMDSIVQHLGISVPREMYDEIHRQADTAPNGKKNVAMPKRHTREMTIEDQLTILDRYQSFYERFFPSAHVEVAEEQASRPAAESSLRLKSLLATFLSKRPSTS